MPPVYVLCVAPSTLIAAMLVWAPVLTWVCVRQGYVCCGGLRMPRHLMRAGGLRAIGMRAEVRAANSAQWLKSEPR